MSVLITPDNHSGPTATTEHYLVKRILASLLLAACAFNASAQNLAPTVNMTAPAANATVVAPASVTLTAEAADSDGTVTKVEFYRDATLLATLTQAPYAYTFSADTAGNYVLSAKATDDVNLATTSAPHMLTVTAPPPVAAKQIYYIYTDQIETAQEITNAAGVKVWKADPDPFGANLPNENPAGQGPFTYNLRFPGQYFDRETGLHYNYYRDYDPQTGRYVQSDPIGLAGGINTFTYADGNPLGKTDRLGLSTRDIDKIVVVYKNILDKMTKDGLRHPWPWWNNACPYYGGPCKYLDCGGQSEHVIPQLEKIPGLDDKWTYTVGSNLDIKPSWYPGHNWIRGQSSNPKDPPIWFDPRAGTHGKNECDVCY